MPGFDCLLLSDLIKLNWISFTASANVSCRELLVLELSLSRLGLCTWLSTLAYHLQQPCFSQMWMLIVLIGITPKWQYTYVLTWMKNYKCNWNVSWFVRYCLPFEKTYTGSWLFFSEVIQDLLVIQNSDIGIELCDFEQLRASSYFFLKLHQGSSPCAPAWKGKDFSSWWTAHHLLGEGWRHTDYNFGNFHFLRFTLTRFLSLTLLFSFEVKQFSHLFISSSLVSMPEGVFIYKFQVLKLFYGFCHAYLHSISQLFQLNWVIKSGSSH